MSDFSTVDEILDYAIGMEQAAVDLYTQIAEKAGTDVARKVFLSFAAEERGHKSKLEAVKAAGMKNQVYVNSSNMLSHEGLGGSNPAVIPNIAERWKPWCGADPTG